NGAKLQDYIGEFGYPEYDYMKRWDGAYGGPFISQYDIESN
ncbi:19301_t:CDS:2, partial [Gigaspora rosea]